MSINLYCETQVSQLILNCIAALCRPQFNLLVKLIVGFAYKLIIYNIQNYYSSVKQFCPSSFVTHFLGRSTPKKCFFPQVTSVSSKHPCRCSQEIHYIQSLLFHNHLTYYHLREYTNQPYL